MLFIALIMLTVALITQTAYLMYYKFQIKDIGDQLAFISEYHSFKFIQTQIKPKEIYRLINLCNTMLINQRKLTQEFIKKNGEVNSVITSLSHDIRTPLTSLNGYLQLADRSENFKEKTEYVMMARNRIKEIITLVNELFLYTKLENLDYKLKLESIDIIKVLNRRLFSFIDDFSLSGYEPTIHIPESSLFIVGNESALERVYDNIIKNYFFHGEGTLSIRYEEQNNEVLLHFTNLLKANHKINMDKLFTRFYKEDRSRTNHSSGLGLFIVKSLMEKMEGYVQANLKHNQFCISLAFNKIQKENIHVLRHETAQNIDY